MALVAAVIAFAQIFSDMGISNAIIHHQKISQEELSSLYWLNVLASMVLMLLLILLSPYIALWYHEPRMQPILMLVSLSFLIAALAQQLRVMAEKQLRFQKIAIIELAASLLSFTTGVLIAFEGGGVYALVLGMLTGVSVTTLLTWCFLAEGWRPLWRLHLGDIKEFLSFGAYMVGFSLINTLNMQADVLIGGRILGTSSLGAFSLPKDLSLRIATIINPIVTRVGLPMMAQAQGDKKLLKSIYLKTLLMTASVNFPLYFMVAIFAPEIVTIMFGSQWQESVSLLRILAFWGLLRSTGNPVGSLVFAIGRPRWMFWWSLGQMLFQVPIFWEGAKYGTQGLAIALLISSAISILAIWYILVRPACGATLSVFSRRFFVPFFISAFAAAISFTTAMLFEMALIRLSKGIIINGFVVERFIVGGIVYPILRISVGIIVGGLAYLILSRWLNKAWFSAIAELLLGRVGKSKQLVKDKSSPKINL